jgi:hypothetical protein
MRALACASILEADRLRTQIERKSEGTPARAPPGTRDHSSSGDSFFVRGFRARGFPGVPAFPVSPLDGKEGVGGSSPPEGFTATPGNKPYPRMREALRRASFAFHVTKMWPRDTL